MNSIINNTIKTLKDCRENLVRVSSWDDCSTDIDKELISDIDANIEKLQTLDRTVMVALLAAVYAGNIEERTEEKVFSHGADSLAITGEYLRIAENYEIPYHDDGLIAIEAMCDDVCNIMLEKYAENK